jgi:hypothetical protein
MIYIRIFAILIFSGLACVSIIGSADAQNAIAPASPLMMDKGAFESMMGGADVLRYSAWWIRTGANTADFLKRAAERDDPLAQAALGVEYYIGERIPRDHCTALSWFARAAKNKHIGATFWAFRINAEGTHSKPDTQAAWLWYSKWADIFQLDGAARNIAQRALKLDDAAIRSLSITYDNEQWLNTQMTLQPCPKTN